MVFASGSYAQFDLYFGSSLRSYPSLGGEVSLDTGYNQLLWGSGPGANKKNILYGLVRPALKISSSAVINSYDAKIEVFPISILSFTVGHQYINSDYDKFTFFDCDEVRCKGTLIRDYVKGRAVIGFGPIVAMGNVVMSRNGYSDEDDEKKPVAEFRFATLADPVSDTMYRSQYILGYQHSSGMYGIMSEYVKFDGSQQVNHFDLLVYSMRPKKTTYIFGIGQFESTHQAKGLILVFQSSYEILPSLKLF